MKKRIVCLLLALVMVLGLVACGQKTEQPAATDTQTTTPSQTETPTETTENGEEAASEPAVDKSAMSYDELSSYIYQEALGDFYDLYMAAKEINELPERFAQMAIAEAKLMESGVFMPNYTAGGSYGMTRVAPYTVNYVLWGSDYDRYHNAVITTEFIKAEDYNYMKTQWAELKGTGTYEQWVKDFLTEKGYTLKDEYSFAYTYNPTNWDVFASYQATDCEATVNTYDGLFEYNGENEIQPALATSFDYTELDDGTVTYTFHLREGVKWVDYQGREICELTADDFVAGMQHLLDAQSGIEYLAGEYGGCNIVNADAYMYGEVTDFSEVGVKALDDYTVEYTLAAPCSFFESMLGYTTFAPLCRTYYESMGGKFGVEYDPSASDYTYGKDPSSIAYCGPYLVSSFTENNSLVFEANPSYWNKDNINIKKITWKYNDGSDPTKSYRDAIAGVIDGCGLSTSTIETAKSEGLFDEYAYVSNTNATSYVVYVNLNRTAFANANDPTKAVSAQSEEDAARTNAAVNNVHFRRALVTSVDKAAVNAQTVGEALKYNSLRNSYTPGNFVTLPEEVTISINGADVTFPAGTYYGEIMQAQLDADGFPVTVWDPEANDGIGSGDGYDGWYNPEYAASELEIAIEELAAQGVVVDESNPIYIDLPYNSGSENESNKANAFKQSVESALGGKVIISLVACVDFTEYGYCGYWAYYGYESNFDIYDFTGWIPDYGDPSSYLDTMLPDYAGYQTKNLGIF